MFNALAALGIQVEWPCVATHFDALCGEDDPGLSPCALQKLATRVLCATGAHHLKGILAERANPRSLARGSLMYVDCIALKNAVDRTRGGFGDFESSPSSSHVVLVLDTNALGIEILNPDLRLEGNLGFSTGPTGA